MSGDSSSGETHSAFFPSLLLTIAVLAWSLFQTTQLVIERGNLKAAIETQNTQMEQSAKVRTAFESLSTRMVKLARSGNANATLIVEELRRRGITINPDAPAAGAGAPAQP
jgi:hypothetical protein